MSPGCETEWHTQQDCGTRPSSRRMQLAMPAASLQTRSGCAEPQASSTWIHAFERLNFAIPVDSFKHQSNILLTRTAKLNQAAAAGRLHSRQSSSVF